MPVTLKPLSIGECKDGVGFVVIII